MSNRLDQTKIVITKDPFISEEEEATKPDGPTQLESIINIFIEKNDSDNNANSDEQPDLINFNLKLY